MHEQLFQSPERPFRATPDARFYFPYDSIEGARQTTVRAVLRAEGPVMVLGGAGLGKSLLGMVVSQDLASRFDIVQLHAARLCSRRALLQNILFELQLPYRDLSEGDLRLSILTRLEPSSDHAPEGVLIIVDEAHTLPAKLLDELRLINNFTRGNQPRTRLVLIGNLRLEHTFAEPQMESFNQRLAARCYLQPMNRQQTCDYIRHQLTVAGLKPNQLVTEDAMRTVYAACDGVPRLTNQVMDHALALAIARDQCPVSSALVEEAWSDLQQLPAPWHVGADHSPLAVAPSSGVSSEVSSGASSGRSSGRSSTVEFGSLEDDHAWPVDSTPATQPLPLAATAQTPSFFTGFVAPYDSAEDLQLTAESHHTADSPSLVDKLQEQPVSSPTDELTREMQISSQAPNQSQPTAGQSAHETTICPDAKDPLVRPRVVFDAGEAFAFAKDGTPKVIVAASTPTADYSIQAFRHATTDEPLVSKSSEAQESFFRNRPTDEKLLALEDEQREYDDMGVWENDPPLAPRVAQADSQDIPIFHHSLGTSQLFGDDFEVEENLNSGGNWLDPLVGNSARQAVEAADYIGLIQQFADSLDSPQAAPQGQQPLAAGEKQLQPTSSAGQNAPAELADVIGNSGLDTWTLNVASLDAANETALHDEIEDMVSQLNFAAFSVEPFSVEQIPIEASEQRPRSTRDSSRKGPNDEIYTMHRPLEPSANEQSRGNQGLFAASADDDRDLLVIEEELPLATKTADEKDAPVTKIAPYSQLFAQLRK